MSSLPLCATRLSIKLGFNCLNAKCKFYNVETRMKNMFGKWVRFEKLRNIFESKISLIRRGALDRFLIRYRPISFFFISFSYLWKLPAGLIGINSLNSMNLLQNSEQFFPVGSDSDEFFDEQRRNSPQ